MVSVRWLRIVLVAVAIVGAAASAPSLAQSLPSDDDWLRTESSRARLFDAVAERLEAVYFDPAAIPWDRWRDRYRDEVAEAASRPAFDAAMRRAFDGLEDGHTRWIGRAALRAGQGVAPEGPSVDLGVEAVPLDGQGLLILRAHPGGAADVAGLRRGDVIVRAGELPLTEPGLGWTMQSRVAAALRTGVAELEVRRAGRAALRVSVEARAVPDGARERPSWRLDTVTAVARIDLPAFAGGSAAALHQAVRDAREAGAQALVIDVRGNPGGSVLELGLVASLVVEGALLESWRLDGPDWTLEVTRDGGDVVARLVRNAGPLAGSDLASARLRDAVRWSGPLAVLVDERSASAAEALAGLLAQDERVVIIGRDTPGNVESVQRIAFPGGNQAWVALGDLRLPGGARVAPVEVDETAELDPSELARGYDAPFAAAARQLRGLPLTPGRWF